MTLMDAVADAATDVTRLYPIGQVPKGAHVPLRRVLRRPGPRETATRSTRAPGLRWVRVTFQGFGHTPHSALAVTEAFISALLGTALEVDGVSTTPLRLELDPTIPTRDPDDSGVLAVTTTLIATQEA
jgi:hypothetical protein